MSNREELYIQFGPKLIEALVLIIKDEVNILRGVAGLAPRTNQQIIDALGNKLNGVSDYNWMSE